MDDDNVRNPLEDLYTDAAGQVESADLLTVLQPYVRIGRDTRKIIFTPKGLSLGANQKVLLFALARKALLLLRIIDSELSTPKEIKSELSGIPVGTIDVAIKRLADRGLLRGEDGKYFVPDFSFPQAREMFSESGEGR